MKTLILLIFVFIVSSCKPNSVQPHSQVEYGSGSDYDVYETVLHRMFDSSSVAVVMYDSTSTSLRGGFEDSVRFADLKDHLPGLRGETLADFISVNGNRVNLMYVRGIDHLVLSSDYDGAVGGGKISLSISRVGYDSLKTQAVVEVGETWAPLAGRGLLYFLELENGEWTIKGSFMTWIS